MFNIRRILLLFFVLLMNIGFAQQNFINVPSSELTDSHKVFFQQQINFSSFTQFNSTVDYGLGKGFEIGCNVLSFNYSFLHGKINANDNVNSQRQLNPLLMLNGLKKFNITRNSSFILGFQYGMNASTKISNIRTANISYLNYSIKNLFIDGNNMVVGAYYNSYRYGGAGNRFGLWLGVEIPINKKLHIMAEDVIGTTDIASSCLGVIYYPLSWMPLTLGWQLNHNQIAQSSFVFELTITPKHDD